MRSRAQYTGNTNSDLAKIRKNLTNRKLGTSLRATLYSDSSIRIMACTSRKPVDLASFKIAVANIVRDSRVDVAEIRFRSTKEDVYQSAKGGKYSCAFCVRTAILTVH